MSKKGDKNWQQEAKDNLNHWQRAEAELDNLKKRTVKEKAEFAQFANRELIMDLLPILDNFERAIEHVPASAKETDNNWLTGITYIQQQLLAVLQNHGVVKKEVKVGDEFDASIHHAVSRETSEANKEVAENHILKVITQAYAMGGEVIRPAHVIVAGDSHR